MTDPTPYTDDDVKQMQDDGAAITGTATKMQISAQLARRPKAKGDSLGDRVWNRQTTPVDALDPWSQARFRKAAERWNHLQKVHRATVQSMWLGTMLTQFDHDDLAVLAAVGYLSIADCDLLARAEAFGPPPVPNDPDRRPEEA